VPKRIPAQQNLLKKNHATGKKIKQVLSTIQVLCLTLKKVLAEVTAHLKK